MKLFFIRLKDLSTMGAPTVRGASAFLNISNKESNLKKKGVFTLARYGVFSHIAPTQQKPTVSSLSEPSGLTW
jgi:hypothetical protein